MTESVHEIGVGVCQLDKSKQSNAKQQSVYNREELMQVVTSNLVHTLHCKKKNNQTPKH